MRESWLVDVCISATLWRGRTFLHTPLCVKERIWVVIERIDGVVS